MQVSMETASKKMQVCRGNCVKKDTSLLWKLCQTRCKFDVETVSNNMQVSMETASKKMQVCCGNCVKQDTSLLWKLCQTRCKFPWKLHQRRCKLAVETVSNKMHVCCGNCVKQDASLLWKLCQTSCKFAVETVSNKMQVCCGNCVKQTRCTFAVETVSNKIQVCCGNCVKQDASLLWKLCSNNNQSLPPEQQPNPSASIWVIRGHQFVIRTRSSGSKHCIRLANSLHFTIISIRGATNNIFHKVSCLYVRVSAMSASSSTCVFASCNASFGDCVPSVGVDFSTSNTAGKTTWGSISSDTSYIYKLRKVTWWFAVVSLFGWVGGSVRGCVSDPRFIQFALCGCYAVHINALSIELKCTSKGATCKLN